MNWQLRGTIVIACNCDWGCPCNFNALPTRGHCEGGWLWLIERGTVDDVVVDGLNMALYSKWPRAIHDGGGHAVCFIDERADAQQRAALTQLLHGKAGGPWGIFINTYQLEGPTATSFDITFADYATKVRLGDNVALELTTMRNPVTGAEVHPEIVLPEGLVLKRGSLCASKTFRLDDVVSYDHSGQYAAFGPFDYKSS